MNGSTNSPPADDQELLVAYLDGELAPDSSAQVEQRLARDDEFRLLLTKLRTTWDLLDDLPQPTLDEGFTRTTVEMVAVKISDLTTPPRPRLSRRLSLIAAGIAVLASSFTVARYWQQQSDRELLNDLPVIQHVDSYSQIESLEFLQALAQQGIFEDQTLEDESEEE